jgi:hypothetical protein
MGRVIGVPAAGAHSQGERRRRAEWNEMEVEEEEVKKKQ